MVKFLKARLFDQRAVNTVSEPTQTQLVPAHLGASVPDDQKLRVEAMFRKIYPSPPLLTVILQRSAASHWLTRTLNELQGLFALHSSRLTLRRLVAADLDDVTYMRLIGQFASGSRTAGDVHAIDRYSVEHLNREFGEHIHCCVMVRDPIPHLKSQIAYRVAENGLLHRPRHVRYARSAEAPPRIGQVENQITEIIPFFRFVASGMSRLHWR